MPYCLTKLALGGGHGVYSVCCFEKTETPRCVTTRNALKQKKTVWGQRGASTYSLDSDSGEGVQVRRRGRLDVGWAKNQGGNLTKHLRFLKAGFALCFHKSVLFSRELPVLSVSHASQRRLGQADRVLTPAASKSEHTCKLVMRVLFGPWQCVHWKSFAWLWCFFPLFIDSTSPVSSSFSSSSCSSCCVLEITNFPSWTSVRCGALV